MPGFQPDTNGQQNSIPIRKARRDFLDYKQDTQKASTARAYKYPTKSITKFCENVGVTETDQLTHGFVNDWIDQRQTEVKPVTVHNNAKHVRVFLKWLGQREYCAWDVHQKIDIPDVPDTQNTSDDVLEESHAEAVLDYLDTYHYASTYHALVYTMWHTGCRISGAIALDLDDFWVENKGTDEEQAVLAFNDRKETGTALKNGERGEREVSISDSLREILNDYIDLKRHDVTDEYGREPLFTTPNRRLYRQRAYKNVVALTRPCVAMGTCPHDREIDDCEAAQDKEKSPSCPSSVSTHPIRKGAIGNHLNEGWPKEILSERVDVSVDVLDMHYDKRKESRKRQNRSQFLHE